MDFETFWEPINVRLWNEGKERMVDEVREIARQAFNAGRDANASDTTTTPTAQTTAA